MSSLQRSAVQLAKSLPPRLQTFLARYPSPSILPAGVDPETAKTPYQQDTPNPFLPHKHPVTGVYHDPVYSLRRQAEMVKLARENGVEELLPFTPKGTLERLRKRVELGLRVKGTGVGQKVKGHKHERQMIAKLVALLEVVVCMLRMLTVCEQDGEEEISHVGDAEPHQGMEEGKSFSGCTEEKTRNANTEYRLESETGPSSPGRRSGLEGVHSGCCTTCNISVHLLEYNTKSQHRCLLSSLQSSLAPPH